ncbi:hypothetical protein [Tateyamaria omphalii]|uniref:hypothetical protein n=1 Tax=Tateyamaria omphalii TaxID=299262 RepID=UPI0012FB6EB1|nr:hypothetical protein [Tateyamaria omphalii]
MRDTLERDDESYLSVFTRAFLPLMTEDRPILSIFAETRIEVERLSKYAAAGRGLPDRQGLQIPHVLFDTIDGQFSLANASATRADAASLADWRVDAQACRFNPLNLDEALKLRGTSAFDDPAEGRVIRACILAAALGDLGIEKLTYDSERAGVVVSNSSSSGNIQQGDLISRAMILDDARNRTQVRITGIDIFYEILEDHYFKDGWLMSLLRTRVDGSNSDTSFESIRF